AGNLGFTVRLHLRGRDVRHDHGTIVAGSSSARRLARFDQGWAGPDRVAHGAGVGAGGRGGQGDVRHQYHHSASTSVGCAAPGSTFGTVWRGHGRTARVPTTCRGGGTRTYLAARSTREAEAGARRRDRFRTLILRDRQSQARK